MNKTKPDNVITILLDSNGASNKEKLKESIFLETKIQGKGECFSMIYMSLFILCTFQLFYPLIKLIYVISVIKTNWKSCDGFFYIDKLMIKSS